MAVLFNKGWLIEMEQFKKMFSVTALTVGLLLAGATAPAMALPVIDGVMGAMEWDGFFVQAFDLNEGGITDSWDISEVRIVQENSGGVSDGLYFLMKTYAAPTFAGGPGSFGDEAFFQFVLDINGNGLFADAVDRRIRLNDPLASHAVTIRDGTGALLGAGTGALGSVIEFFAPESLFTTTDFSLLKGTAQLDNSGTEPDDQIPDEGFFTPTPEPTSLSLLGFGVLGLLGTSFRRRRL